VGGIQLSAFICSREHSDRAIPFRADDLTTALLACNQAPFSITRISVRVRRGLAEQRDVSAFLVPTQHSTIGNVAPNKTTQIAKPDRPLGPTIPGVNGFEKCNGIDERLETRINGFEA
jgi:hypothetical protein